tara:strand:+ start:7646 stop:8173 length:528 start_codon:yes stop_codon:yes gene_type:complete
VTAPNQQPDNTNFLSPVGFKFLLKRAPTVNYFCQSASIPSISLGEIIQDTPFTKIHHVGDKLVFDNFSLRFRVDEHLSNYLEIFNWLLAIGFPDDFNQYKAIADRPSRPSQGDVRSDATLMVLTSAGNPKVEVNLRDIFPIALSTLEFNSATQDIEYLEADVQFALTKFDINVLT